MTKIVVTHPMGLSSAQQARLARFGEVTYHDTHPNPNEWVERCQGFDIICSWITGLREHYSQLHDVFISVPFVGVSSFLDSQIVANNHLTISNSPGSNRHAVSEWITYMLLYAMRQIHPYINITTPVSLPLPTSSVGLAGKNIIILGRGNIGSRVGDICQALGMHVTYFVRGDNLVDKVKDAEVVVDTLSSNPTSRGLLNQAFFASLKKGAIFISVTVGNIVDFDAMIAALDSGQLSFVAHDVMDIKPGDTTNPIYQKLISHSRVIATPHISAFTAVTNQLGNDMMIDNIEAYLDGKPIHVFT